MKPKVVYYHDFSRPGNDCNIKESVTVIEEFGRRNYRHRRIVSGWSPSDEAYETHEKCEFVRHLKNSVFVSVEALDRIFDDLEELEARRW